MDAKRYKVIFSGKLSDNAKPSEVLARLTELLQKEETEVRELFKVGSGAVIFDDLTGGQAYARQEDLRGIGVIASVKEIPPPPPLEELSGAMMTTAPLKTVPAAQQHRRPSTEPRMYTPQVQPEAKSGISGLLIKLILLAAVIGAGWWGYHTWLTPK